MLLFRMVGSLQLNSKYTSNRTKRRKLISLIWGAFKLGCIEPFLVRSNVWAGHKPSSQCANGTYETSRANWETNWKNLPYWISLGPQLKPASHWYERQPTWQPPLRPTPASQRLDVYQSDWTRVRDSVKQAAATLMLASFLTCLLAWPPRLSHGAARSIAHGLFRLLQYAPPKGKHKFDARRQGSNFSPSELMNLLHLGLGQL